jgi:hypothetical protein
MKNTVIIIFILLNFLTSCRKDKVQVYPNANCSDTVSFNNEILPLIQNNCTGCHDNQNGYTFTNHSNISANSNAIIGSMRNNGYQLMPKGGPALDDSIIQRIECWVNQGKLNN